MATKLEGKEGWGDHIILYKSHLAYIVLMLTELA